MICFKLHEGKPSVVASTAAATLRQAVMLIFERVTTEDAQDTPQGKEGFSPALQDAYDLLSDLCLLTRVSGATLTTTGSLGNLFASIAEHEQQGEVKLLKNLSGVGRTFGLELVESLVGGFEGCLKAVRLAASSPERHG